MWSLFLIRSLYVSGHMTRLCSQEHTTKKTNVTIRLGIELKSIDYILGSIVNTIGKAFVIV